MDEDLKQKGWLKGCLYLWKHGKRQYLLNFEVKGHPVVQNLKGRDRETIRMQGKPVGRVSNRYEDPLTYYEFLGFDDPPKHPTETDEEYIDYDSVVGHWIQGAIYIWRHGMEWKKTGRHYVVPQLTTKNVFSSTECKKFFGQIITPHVSRLYDLRIQGKRIVFSKVFLSIQEIYLNEGLEFPDFEAIFSSPKNYITSVSKAKLTPLKLPLDQTYTPGPVIASGKLPYGSYEVAARLYYLEKGLPIYYPSFIPENVDRILDFLYKSSIIVFNDEVIINEGFSLSFLNALDNPKIDFIATDVVLYKSGQESGHANIFFVDKKRKLVELIDPHGKTKPKYNTDLILKDIQNRLELEDYKAYQSHQVCPHFSFQIFENFERYEDNQCGDLGGYCAQWTRWILELRALNPDLSPERVYRLAIETIEKDKKSFSFIIRTYTKRVRQIADKLDLLFHTDRPEFYRYIKSFYDKQPFKKEINPTNGTT